MKKTAKTLLIAALAMVCPLVLAQEMEDASDEKPNYQLMVVHMEDVKPSMTTQYEESSRELSTMLAKHNIKDVYYSALRNDENQFLYVTPIKSMADLDKKMFSSLEAKAGKEAVKNMMKKFDNCLTSYNTQVVAYWPGQSYKPETKDGENYRVWDFWYYDPSHSDEAKKLLKEWIALYEKHDIASGFRAYSPIIGVDGPGYVIVSWAKGPAEHAQQADAIMKTLGKEGKDLMDRTLKITTRMKTNTGYYLPELSYQPPEPVASGN